MPIRWSDPPERQQPNKFDAPDWVAELVARPGHWALVMDGLSQNKANYYQSQINLGLWVHTRDRGEWEATQRRMPDGTQGLWVRFIK